MKTMKAILASGFVLLAANTAHAFENISPNDAYSMATSDPDTIILDVRSRYEWGFVGHPSHNPKNGMGSELTGKVANISVMVVSGEEVVPNKFFVEDVKKMMESNPNMKFITMCRSGKRSVVAAGMLEAAGIPVMNMSEGFEGGKDANGYRTINGWKNASLPYTAACDGNGYARYKFTINDAGKIVPPNAGE